MSDKGHDYGMGITNINPETGIRFGVIPQNDVLQAWCDGSEPDYGDIPDDEELPDFCEPIGFVLDADGYRATCGDDGDIFILKSPYFTYAQFCSPCAPGACHLRNPLDEADENNRCYCFGHDWFEDGKAPYPVYRVDTREQVTA